MTYNELGCGDGGCYVRRPKGMHTNGGCRCVFRELTHGLGVSGDEAVLLGKRKRRIISIVQTMRDEIKRLEEEVERLVNEKENNEV